MTSKPQIDDFRVAMCQALGVPEDQKLLAFAVRFQRGRHIVTITTEMWDFEKKSMIKHLQRFTMVKQ